MPRGEQKRKKPPDFYNRSPSRVYWAGPISLVVPAFAACPRTRLQFPSGILSGQRSRNFSYWAGLIGSCLLFVQTVVLFFLVLQRAMSERTAKGKALTEPEKRHDFFLLPFFGISESLNTESIWRFRQFVDLILIISCSWVFLVINFSCLFCALSKF